ncbi:MAG TPA: cytochrome c [Candidatus Dormibacteraeota bacterium]|nr:cytochrome c [Candidatus Dormibacteraeota bacterium]
MRKNWLYTAALVLGTASLAWAAPTPGNAKEGKAVYGRSCQGCHGMDGKGSPSLAKMMHVTMLPLGSKQVQAKSDAQLKKDIVDGIGKMPPQKSLSAKDVDDVIAYIRELGKSAK